MGRERLSARRIEKAIDRAAAKAAEAYEANTGRAAVVLIPYVGGAVDVIFTSEAQRISKQRVHKLIENMKERMEAVEKEAISKEYLQSEEFIDLVLKAFDSAIKTRETKKYVGMPEFLQNRLSNLNRESILQRNTFT